ncbi:hypothetical protein AMD27_03125 [Acinetobacter sp. TGL-Y2]|nr:hypothetical protein AMD27_03125 [Acinetobacter sp. TGL-Y2]
MPRSYAFLFYKLNIVMVSSSVIDLIHSAMTRTNQVNGGFCQYQIYRHLTANRKKTKKDQYSNVVQIFNIFKIVCLHAISLNDWNQ